MSRPVPGSIRSAPTLPPTPAEPLTPEEERNLRHRVAGQAPTSVLRRLLATLDAARETEDRARVGEEAVCLLHEVVRNGGHLPIHLRRDACDVLDRAERLEMFWPDVEAPDA